jgi:hypothetical protein
MTKRQILLSEASDDELIRELARRLRASGKKASAGSEQVGNAARLQMIRALQSPSPHGQPIEILRFLTQQSRSQTMMEITGHMRSLGYSASRYYDASNALTDLGLAEVAYKAGEKTWLATVAGKGFIAKMS